MDLLSRPRRPRRSHEWNAGTAVTFIVTLAATGSVTLAAREAGMSRKSAYALRARDPAFAASWDAALNASKGHKVDEVDRPPISTGQGNSRTAAAASLVSTDRRQALNGFDTLRRDAFFARLAARSGTGRNQPVDK
jgi:hypothetical protein